MRRYALSGKMSSAAREIARAIRVCSNEMAERASFVAMLARNKIDYSCKIMVTHLHHGSIESSIQQRETS